MKKRLVNRRKTGIQRTSTSENYKRKRIHDMTMGGGIETCSISYFFMARDLPSAGRSPARSCPAATWRKRWCISFPWGLQTKGWRKYVVWGLETKYYIAIYIYIYIYIAIYIYILLGGGDWNIFIFPKKLGMIQSDYCWNGNHQAD